MVLFRPIFHGNLGELVGDKTGNLAASWPLAATRDGRGFRNPLIYGEPAGTRTQGPRLKRAGEYCTLSLYFTRGSVSFQAVGRIAKNCHEFPV